MTEIYELFYSWVGSIFSPDMSLKVWQYIYGADIIATREDLITYASELLSLLFLALVIGFIINVFVAIFKLLYMVIKR